MKNSFIISFLSKAYSFFCTCYENSFLKKISDGVVWFFKKITENSFFVNFFSAPCKNNLLPHSLLWQFSRKLLAILRKIFSKPTSSVKESVVFKFFASFYENVLNYSTTHFALVALIAAPVYAVVEMSKSSMTPLMYGALALLVLASVVLWLINTSLYNLFAGSILVKLASKLFEEFKFDEKETVAITKKSVSVCVLIGFSMALCASLTTPLYAAIFFAGIFGAGWILYNYSVGIFIAAVMLPFAPTMVLALLILFTFASFVLRFVFDDKMKFNHTSLDVPIFFFAVVLVISSLTSFAVKSSVMSVLVYLAFILSYYLLTNSIKTKKHLCALVTLMLYASLLVALYGIYQYVFGFAEGTTWIDEDMFSDIETRVVSTFENPNVLGEYLLLLIPIGLSFVWGLKKGYNKLIHLAIVCALSVCMIFTYSRGNWIGLLFAIILFFMFYDRRFVWLGAIALLLSPFVLPQNVINRFLSVGDMGDTSTSYRVYIWLGTLNMLKDYWLCGIGIGTEAFNRIYPMYAYSGVMAPHSHNLYLQVITENGIFGLVVFLSIVFVYFKDCISTIIKTWDKLLKGIITGCAAGMFGYLVQGMFDNVWYNYRVFLLFFVIIGITVSCISISKREKAV